MIKRHCIKIFHHKKGSSALMPLFWFPQPSLSIHKCCTSAYVMAEESRALRPTCCLMPPPLPYNQWIIEMPPNGIPLEDFMGGLGTFFLRHHSSGLWRVSSLPLFSHMESNKHATSAHFLFILLVLFHLLLFLIVAFLGRVFFFSPPKSFQMLSRFPLLHRVFFSQQPARLG